MIQLQQVSKIYNGTKAVSNISIDIKEGENLVLLGTSGCGKTTTLRMINRLTEPSAGSIVVNGKNIQQQPAEELRKGMGYVLQHNGLFPHYTVAENIAIVPKLLKWSNEKIAARINELLEKLHLPAATYAHVYPNELSGGQQQRVGLARALAADPPILLMDEPFGALDPVTRTNIRKEFTQLEEFQKKTIVLVTHDVQEAFELGNRICLMDKGSVVQIGTPAELLFKPASNFINSFLGEQRFALELQAILLSEIVDYLPDADTVSTTIIANKTTLWNALQTVTTNEQASIEGAQKKLTTETLLAAFATYKTSLS